MQGAISKPRRKAPSAAQRAWSASEAAEVERGDKVPCSSRRITEVVLRLFHGVTLDALSRQLRITPGRLARWRDEALRAMQAGLQSREPDLRDGFLHGLKAKIGDKSILIELLVGKIETLEDDLGPPLRGPSL